MGSRGPQRRSPLQTLPATSLFTIAAAIIAFIIAGFLPVAEPRQLIANAATTGAFIGYLRGSHSRGEALTFRLILAGNLLLVASDSHHSAAARAFGAIIALAIIIAATRAHLRHRS